MKSSSKSATQGQLAAAIIAILFIIAGTAFAWYWIQQQSLPPEESQIQQPEGSKEEVVPTPTPTPTKLFHGKDTYSVSGGTSGLKISGVSFDPLDPAVGSTQIIMVKISSETPITVSEVRVRTDTKTTTVPLTRTSGTDSDGVWEGRWIIPESYLYNYIPTVIVKSGNGKIEIPITIRERK